MAATSSSSSLSSLSMSLQQEGGDGNNLQNAVMGGFLSAAVLMSSPFVSTAGATPVPVVQQQQSFDVVSSSVMVSETSLDFSLPKYDTKMSGFGDGKEAVLNGSNDMTDPGTNEKAKQMEAMKKAEEARLEAKAAKKAQMKALEEEAQRRSELKKAENADRLKNIWN
eukprot:CAMPEP_0113454098 /NCGR_PEP_ID=MMETSP0014_2-20120614/7691_1 /TAXON_ID=2857 /ORGANISM="Nitzschia sp." /LENGTH=166 /DNA_ID=CAMNT_0000345499 /DNA_START=118 /DNA_END=618 /DNA_ORIENTATION=- /assembly_acc=CAM_ASM_000159